MVIHQILALALHRLGKFGVHQCNHFTLVAGDALAGERIVIPMLVVGSARAREIVKRSVAHSEVSNIVGPLTAMHWTLSARGPSINIPVDAVEVNKEVGVALCGMRKRWPKFGRPSAMGGAIGALAQIREQMNDMPSAAIQFLRINDLIIPPPPAAENQEYRRASRRPRQEGYAGGRPQPPTLALEG